MLVLYHSVPHGEKHIELIKSICPIKVVRSSYVTVSHSLIVLVDTPQG